MRVISLADLCSESEALLTIKDQGGTEGGGQRLFWVRKRRGLGGGPPRPSEIKQSFELTGGCY